MSLCKQNAGGRSAGFSLLELLISVAILVIIAGATLGTMAFYQRQYRGSDQRVALHQQMRAALEQISQEVGQAGLSASGLAATQGIPGLATLSSAASAGASTISVSSIAGIYAGQHLMIGADGTATSGQSPDWIQVLGTDPIASPITVGTLTGAATTLSYTHPLGALVLAPGAIARGILPPSMTGGSTANSLRIFGDVDGDGTLDLIVYDCSNQQLKRKRYDYTANSTVPTSVSTLIQALSTDCTFTYTTHAATTVGCADTVVVAVSITITATTETPDATVAGKFNRFTLTKSMMNIQPRNILNAYNLMQSGSCWQVQPLPQYGVFSGTNLQNLE